MRVFIGMETSGALRRRFAEQGHDVISCDVLEAEDGGEIGRHIVSDVFEALQVDGWWPDLAMFHITCTYLTNSAAWAFNDPDFAKYPGVGYHQRVKPGTLVAGRMVGCVERWANQTDSGQNRLSPGVDRWKDRSRTFPGIADAMAHTWGVERDVTNHGSKMDYTQNMPHAQPDLFSVDGCI